jgi:uroporphyrinogen-III synthase
MLLIVTRPRAQAQGWVSALRALGQQAAALPLIQIVPVADAGPVHTAWSRLDGFVLLVFVSANAVASFFALAPPGAAWPPQLRAGSTGPGTSAALLAAGVPRDRLIEPAADAAAFDSEALWTQLSSLPWAGKRVLVVRGEEGRDWLADTLRGQGATVEFVAAYARRAPQWDAAERALLDQALAEPAAHLWLFSSSEGLRHLQTLAPSADWSAAQAIASHPRIAQAAQALGFGRVEVVAPMPQAVAERAAAWPGGGSPRLQSAPS